MKGAEARAQASSVGTVRSILLATVAPVWACLSRVGMYRAQ